jgi:hypothetical protein
MKNWLNIGFVLVVLLFPKSILAQENQNKNTDEVKYLFGNMKSFGYYGAFTFGYSKINGEPSLHDGGRLAIIINKKLGIGLAGIGFNNKPVTDSLLEGRYSLKGNIAGLLIEPILFSDKAIHLTLPLVLGAGRITYENDNSSYGNHNQEAKDIFWAFQSGIELEANVFKFFRMSFGATYKLVPNVDLIYRVKQSPIVERDFLKGFSYSVSFKFGKF